MTQESRAPTKALESIKTLVLDRTQASSARDPHARHNSGRTIKSVARALTILELLRDAPKGATATELAAHLGLTPASTFQLLRTLEHFEFVSQDADSKRYELGDGIGRLAVAFSNDLALIKVVSPHLYRLHERCGEDIHLSVWHKDTTRDILTLKSSQATVLNPAMEDFAPMGQRLHCTATGKLFLAHMPEAQAVAIVRKVGFLKRTPRTIDSLEILLEELRRVRKQGYALSDGEQSEGMLGMGVPVYDYVGHVMAVIAMGLPAERGMGERRAFLLEQLTSTAHAISLQLGYGPSR
jgi:DNA-binding IclR family transcriptional regulator